MKFTIVIPTLNRRDVLHYSINSILNQKGNHDLSIIISNNCSDDNTFDYIKSLQDKRIFYVEPNKRLSMACHWEFASQFVDKTDENGLVMFLGDDDILNQNALNIAENLFSKNEIDALRRTTGYYYTPDCPISVAGFLFLPPLDGVCEIRNSMTMLQRVASGKAEYSELPFLYHGFVRSTILGELLKYGPLFNKASPDIYSAINIAALNIEYASINYPLTLGVASPKSNGLNYLLNSSISKEFIKSSYNELDHVYPIDSIYLHILDCLEDVIRRHNLDIAIDYKKYYYNVIKVEGLHTVSKTIPFLEKISGNSRLRIYADAYITELLYFYRRLPQTIKYSLRNVIILLFSRSKGFSYVGDLKKKGIYDPVSCMDFIENNMLEKNISLKVTSARSVE